MFRPKGEPRPDARLVGVIPLRLEEAAHFGAIGNPQGIGSETRLRIGVEYFLDAPGYLFALGRVGQVEDPVALPGGAVKGRAEPGAALLTKAYWNRWLPNRP